MPVIKIDKKIKQRSALIPNYFYLLSAIFRPEVIKGNAETMPAKKASGVDGLIISIF